MAVHPSFRLATLLGLLVTGCINLPSEDRALDIRILAMRAEPPELLYSFMHMLPAEERGEFPLGPYGITVKTLAVDPRGREVETSVRFCPEDVEGPCKGYRLRADAPAQQLSALVPLVEPVVARRRADLYRGGEIDMPVLSLSIPDVGMDYMVPHDADGRLSMTGLLFPSFPMFVARVDVPGEAEQEIAFKRIQLSMDLSASGLPVEMREPLQQMFKEVLGLEFCPPGTDPYAEVGCLKERRPNANPTLERILVRMGSLDEEGGGPADEEEDEEAQRDPTQGGQFTDFVGRLSVRQGESVIFRAMVAEGDHEPYQEIAFNMQTGKAVLSNYVEDMAYSWYNTHGSTDRITTERQRQGRRTNWSQSDFSVGWDSPEGPAYVWVIVRDQRGGTDWRRLDFDVLEGESSGVGGGPF